MVRFNDNQVKELKKILLSIYLDGACGCWTSENWLEERGHKYITWLRRL